MNTTTNLSADALASTTFAAFKEAESISFIRAYDPKAQAISGYRHAVIRYRDADRKAGTVSKPAKMVTIPAVIFPEEYSLLPAQAIQVFLGVIEDQQDVLIREAIDNGATMIYWQDITLEKCLASLTAVRTANYLTKEQIAAWVRASMSVHLRSVALQIAEAKAYDDNKTALQIAATLNAYVDNYSKLAAKVPNIGQDVATKLQNQLLLANLADDMANKLKTKLHSILNPSIASEDLG